MPIHWILTSCREAPSVFHTLDFLRRGSCKRLTMCLKDLQFSGAEGCLFSAVSVALSLRIFVIIYVGGFFFCFPLVRPFTKLLKIPACLTHRRPLKSYGMGHTFRWSHRVLPSKSLKLLKAQSCVGAAVAFPGMQ